jgi:FkbM family methyltransferase
MVTTLSDISSTPAPDLGRLLKHSPALRIATAGYRLLPRGKGAFARAVGRFLVRDGFFVEVPTPHGCSIVASAATLDMGAFLQVDKDWDDHVLEACIERTKDGGAFFDIGSNLGYMAISVARNGPKELAVVAFEPNPQLAQAIALSAEIYNFPVQVFSVALDESNGETDFFIPGHAIHASLVVREQDARLVRVQSIRLDDLVASGKLPPPTVIKIDVEGAEMRVFAGAEQTLRTHNLP